MKIATPEHKWLGVGTSVRFILLFGLLVALAQGCFNRNRSSDAGSDSDAVQQILSEDKPPYRVPWRLTQDLSVGTARGDDHFVLRVPRCLAVMSSGTMVVLDDRPVELRVYDAAGKFVRSFGQPGPGPVDLHLGGTNQMLLFTVSPVQFEYWADWPPLRQRWNLNGELEDVKSFPGDHPIQKVGLPYRYWRTEDRMYAQIPNGMMKTPKHSHTELIVLTSWTGSEPMKVIEIPTFDWATLGDLRIPVGMAESESDYALSARHLVTHYGRIFVSKTAEDWIHEYDPVTGDEVRRFRLALDKPMTLAASDVAPDDRGGKWWQENTWQAVLAEGPDGQVWVQRTFEPSENGTWPTDVFAADGHFLGRLELAFEPRTMKITNDRLYGFGFGQEGQPVLLRYQYRPSASPAP